MKFGEYVNRKGKLVNESSLSRLWRHMQNHDAGTITAHRDAERDENKNIVKEYTRKDNQARNKVLFAKLHQKYSVTKVKGSYIENYGTPQAKEVGESVFFVVDNSDRGDLEKTLKKLGREFNQDSILFIPKGSNKGILWGTKKDEFSNKYSYPKYGSKVELPKAVWGKEGQFMTKIKGRPFLFEEELTEIKIKGFFANWGMSILARENWENIVE